VHPTHVCDESGDSYAENCDKPHDGDGLPPDIVHASVTDGEPESFYDPTSSDWPRKFYSINNMWQEDGHPSIAVHPKCLSIAERVVDFKKILLGDNVEQYAATSLGCLYEIYRQRCTVLGPGYISLPPAIHPRLGAPRFL
jgi:hypothetical protein